MKNALLYARVSTGKQAERQLSIPDQLRAMNEYCKKRGIRVVEEFVDAGRSATNDNRPQFRRLLEVAQDESADVDMILLYSFTRGFRNLEDMHYYQKILRGRGVRLVAITEEYDEDDPQGKMMVSFAGMVAEMFSLENSKHVKRAMRQNARGGFFNGSHPPFGYTTAELDLPAKTGKKRKIVLDEKEAELVREIFDLYEHGHEGRSMGMKAIAKYLNDAGKLRRNRRWQAQSIHIVLSDAVYLGTYLFGGRRDPDSANLEEGKAIPVPVPQIIDEARFKRLAVRRVERSPTKTPMLHTNPPSLLTGLCRCGYCGYSMSIATGKGGQYRYLKCNKRNVIDNAMCRSPNVPAEKFETMLLEAVCGEVLSEDRVRGIFDDCVANVDVLQGKEGKDIDRLIKAKTEIQRRLANLYKLVEDGFDPNEDSLKKRLRTHQEELQALTVKIEDLKVKVLVPKSIFESVAIKEFSAGMRQVLADRENPLAKDFLRLFVKEVRVYAEEATITGPNLGLAEAAIRHKGGTPQGVPSSMHKWRRERLPNNLSKILIYLYKYFEQHSMALISSHTP